MINSYLGCPRQDSNLHASQHSHLKRARLPFRHLGKCRIVIFDNAKVMLFFLDCNCFCKKKYENECLGLIMRIMMVCHNAQL